MIIKFTGYGTVPKSFLSNPDIPIQAKGIYCYLASYSNQDKVAFPSRERILKELSLSKNGYYGHYNFLTSNGYIGVDSQNYKNNKYFLCADETDASELIPVYKSVMSDSTISVSAKAFCAYVTAYRYNYHRAVAMKELNISAKKYAALVDELTNAGYINIEYKNRKYNISLSFISSLPKEDIQTDSIPNKDTVSMQNEDMISMQNSDTLSVPNEDTKNNIYNNIIINQSYQEDIEDINTEKEIVNADMTDGQTESIITELCNNNKNSSSLYPLAVKALCFAISSKYNKQNNNRLTVINALNTCNDSLPVMLSAFVEYYKEKIKNRKIYSPVAYMVSCLQDYIINYNCFRIYSEDDLFYADGSRKSYGASYNIAEYESTSVLDEDWWQDDSEQPSYAASMQ